MNLVKILVLPNQYFAPDFSAVFIHSAIFNIFFLCQCWPSPHGWEDRGIFWDSSWRLLPPVLESPASPKHSDCITFIPGNNCLNSVMITSAVCSVNHLLGEITSLSIFILFLPYCWDFKHLMEGLCAGMWSEMPELWFWLSPDFIEHVLVNPHWRCVVMSSGSTLVELYLLLAWANGVTLASIFH